MNKWQKKKKELGIKTNKKAYWVSSDDENGFGIIAKNEHQARSIMVKIDPEFNYDAYISYKAKRIWCNADHLPIGELEDEKEGLRLGIYGSFEDRCDLCKGEDLMYASNIEDGKFVCDTCKAARIKSCKNCSGQNWQGQCKGCKDLDKWEWNGDTEGFESG